ncbi:3'-5' exonuclease [Piscirickettsia litoralis]|nr:3'-5' exonuclease [Piscirickettsia litoralis]
MAIFLDTETTGLTSDDEIVEIAIIDDSGQTLLNTLVKPVKNTTWPQAQRIHKISPDMVVDAPTLDDLSADIKGIVSGQELVIYNAGFDTKFLKGLLDDAESIQCCMLAWAQYAGEWNDYYNSYKWHKLIVAAAAINYQWSGTAHRALADTLACRAVWDYLKSKASC